MNKSAFIFVFDRTNGTAGLAHRGDGPRRKATRPGEWYSPTQPFPTKPAAFDRQGVTRGRSGGLHSRDQGRGFEGGGAV